MTVDTNPIIKKSIKKFAMNKLKFPIALLSLFALLLISCEKTALVPTEKETIANSARYRKALGQAIKSIAEKELQDAASVRSGSSDNGNGAEFIIPFSTSEGFGAGRLIFEPFSLELVEFSTELGAKDFTRKNPDGTVTMHINSKKADAFYTKDLFGTDPALTGSNATLMVNYTGVVVDEPLFDDEWNIIGYVQRLRVSDDRNAISVLGMGNVRDEENGGPSYFLQFKATDQPGDGRRAVWTLR